MRKVALHLREHSEVRDNIVFFPPQYNHRMQRIAEAKFTLNQQPHLFILMLGFVIGGIISLFIGYHIAHHVLSYVALFFLPITIAYLLRRVYIHTLMQNLDD